MKIILIFLIVLAGTGIFSCRKTFDNPNAASPDDLVKTPEGMAELIVGIKNRFAVNSNLGVGGLFNAITANGFTTFELNLRAGGNTSFVQLANGKDNLPNTNVVLTELWSNCMLINDNCTLLTENLKNVKDQSLSVNIKKYANLYKAMAIGTLAAFWEKVPVVTGKNAVFVDSTTALNTAIALLDEAAQLPNLPLPDVFKPYFGNDINVNNSLLALSARYNLMAGHFDKAIRQAESVTDLKSKSYFIYNAQNSNPLFTSGFTSTFGYSPKTKFGLTDALTPVPADSFRTIFYTKDATGKGAYGFGKTNSDVIPLYLPGELMLIQAEAYTRLGDTVKGKKFLDMVLTKTTAQDPYGVGAGLPAYSGPMDPSSLLQEIYKNRCIELFMSGLKLSDSRRFRRPGPTEPKSERNRNYYPYPLQERSGNPNTPPDPLN